MQLLESAGWQTADRTAPMVVRIQGEPVGGLLGFNVEKQEIVVDCCEMNPGDVPRVPEAAITHRLRVYAALEAHEKKEGEPWPMIQLYWTGEGWLDFLSRPRPGPKVEVLARETA